MTDTLTVRIVVVFLGLLSLLSVGGLIWLVSVGTPADRLAIVAGPAGTVIGALATLLVSTRSGPQPGTVVETTTSTTSEPPAQTAAIPSTLTPAASRTSGTTITPDSAGGPGAVINQ